MKKRLPVLLAAVAALALGGCDFFKETVEYNVSGGPGIVSLRYQDEDGDIVDVAAAAPWSTSFEVGLNDRPFLAFLQATNGAGAPVNLYILVGGSQVASLPGLAASATGYIAYIVE